MTIGGWGGVVILDGVFVKNWWSIEILQLKIVKQIVAEDDFCLQTLNWCSLNHADDEFVFRFDAMMNLIIAEDEIWFCYIFSELKWHYSMLEANSASVWSSPRTFVILFDGPVNLRAELPWNDAGDELYDWMGTMIEHLAEVQRLLQPVIFRRLFKWKTGFYYFYCR